MTDDLRVEICAALFDVQVTLGPVLPPALKERLETVAQLVSLDGMRTTPDPVVIDHPSHYGGDTTYEAIKVIEAWGLGFNLGNALKYICRAGKKQPSVTTYVNDLKKARWYLDREIQLAEPKR
jgi:hypothetical protein